MKSYNVVFEYTKEAGGYEGVITWTSFKSKKEFDEWYTADKKRMQRVLEESVSEKKAVKYVDKTPLSSYFRSCIEDATNKKTEEISREVLEMKLSNVLVFKGLPMGLVSEHARLWTSYISMGMPLEEVVNYAQEDLDFYKSLGKLTEC